MLGGSRLTGVFDSAYSKALLAYELLCGDDTYSVYETIDYSGLVPGTVCVSLSDQSTQTFSPISDAAKSFSAGERMVLSIRNTGTTAASGTYKLMAEDASGNLIGLKAKQKFAVSPGKTFESPTMFYFAKPLSAGVYQLRIVIEGAQATESALGTLRVYSESDCQIGDVNLDGRTDVADVTEIQRFLAEVVTLNETQLAAADTNGDGAVTVDDVTHLLSYLAEFENVALGQQPDP